MHNKFRVFLILILSVGLLPVLPVLAQGGDELTETYTSDDQRVTFNYPAEWTIEKLTSGVIFLSNNTAVLETMMSDDSVEALPTKSLLMVMIGRGCSRRR